MAAPAQRDQIAGNIDAGDSPTAADSGGDAFAQKARAATDIQYPLAGRKRELLHGLRSLRHHIRCEVDPCQLSRGFFGEGESAHGCLGKGWMPGSSPGMMITPPHPEEHPE